MLVWTKKELNLIKKLNTPTKIQNYLDSLPFNFEEGGFDTIKSPIRVIREGNAHCLEGAILGAFLLSEHGFSPLLLHLESIRSDFDHMVVPFRIDGLWGALSKTNHYTLRYREPVYRDIRELVMSYFHEYFLNKNGQKTLRRYSKPLNLKKIKLDWPKSEEDLWIIDRAIDRSPHYDVIPKKVIKNLRPADEIERMAGNLVNYKPQKAGFKDPNLA